MRTGPPSYEIKQILKQYDSRVVYLQGSPLNHYDLSRCGAETARCAIIMSNHFCNNHQTEDYRNILGAFSIKKYAKQNKPHSQEIRICLQIAKPDHKDLYQSGLSKS